MSEQIDYAIRWATERFEQCSESARLDAELLLAHCLDKPRSYLYSWPEKQLEEARWQAFQNLVQQRLEPTPIAYLLGSREFFSIDFETTTAALIPRAETELLVELALAEIEAKQQLRILDLGTGTGIIAITLKKLRPLLHVCATDVDPACLQLATRNALRHEVAIDFIHSDWYQNVPTEAFDIIVSNPPYIAADHPFLKQGDLPAEPGLALTPGHTGLESLEQIIVTAPVYLVAGGRILLEHGYDQQTGVAGLLLEHGFEAVECHYDFNDLPRVTTAKLIEKHQPRA